MTRARTIFLLSLATLLLLGYTYFHPLLPHSGFWQGLGFGAVLGLAIGRGWYLFQATD